MGVDVSANRGLDVVVLDAGRRLTMPPRSTVSPAELTGLLEEIRPATVAIDAPYGWAASGRSRAGERAVARLGISMYFTPSEEIGSGRAFYNWVHHGNAAFAAAEAAGYRRYSGGALGDGHVFEVYPHATAVVLRGELPARGSKKRVVRTEVLIAAGVPVEQLRTQDHLDAALAALTALLASEDDFTAVGDPDEGLLVLPSRSLPTTRYARMILE